MITCSASVVLGIGGVLGHDANAALLVDGRLVASSQEERHSRRKHDGAFPRLAALDSLSAAGLGAHQVTDVVFAEKQLQSRLFDLTGRPGNRLTRALGRLLPPTWGSLYGQQAQALFPAANFHHAWHHLSHVAGAFHSSPFDRAAFLCVDGKGEESSASAGIIDHGEIRLLWEQPYANGLGMFYTLLTYHLGFLSFGSEYKVMGLAPYGAPRYTAELARLFSTDERGGFRLHRDISFTWEALLAALPWVANTIGVPVRKKSDPLLPVHMDLAASLQKIFEDEVLKMARFIRRESGEQQLLFCGGCAQNCVAAGQLRRAGLFRTIFNSPVGGDMGSALGAALLFERTRTRAPLRVATRGFGLGSEPGPVPVAAHPYRLDAGADLHAFVAGQLAGGKIVAVVRGGMELGARALGARSIFADPRAPGMQSRLNLAVKFRESFRPFAPAVLAEHVSEWFDTDAESDYMNYTAYLRPELRIPVPADITEIRARLDFPRCSIPSVIHVDFSARLQTIRPSVHPDFHRFISAFHALTGVPILINTSFNVAGQPIVRTAAEGWDCFVNTDIDLLVLNDEVFRNPFEKTQTQKLSWLAQFATSA
jgi:carbamoyltransferase